MTACERPMAGYECTRRTSAKPWACPPTASTKAREAREPPTWAALSAASSLVQMATTPWPASSER